MTKMKSEMHILEPNLSVIIIIIIIIIIFVIIIISSSSIIIIYTLFKVDLHITLQ